ncbi:MAG: carbon storage regulator [Pirellulaceae bacterium]
MLVLSRKIGDTIRIGDDIEIVVNRISGNRVTIGIDAPKDVRILRGEVEDETKEVVRHEIEIPLDALASFTITNVDCPAGSN